ncbi:MAG: N-acetylmuramoyl-L-alanine amidase [Candidatus Gastranaerophilales bacterium]|nr:N-acetylmuramoyl-L-alanine amidase [Candidatus Gastranaerophilales bacterium]
MKKILLSILCFFIFCTKVEALNIVYPKTNPAKINASSTFFIGSTNPRHKIKINDIDVNVSSKGAFAQAVPLNVGINYFQITSSPPITEEGKSMIINFIIERVQPKNVPQTTPTLTEYPMMNNFFVKNDNAPLRMTPIDGGINRMSHLPKDAQLYINGEKNDFYRVYLNTKLTGWIAKNDVEQREDKKLEDMPKLNPPKIKEEKDFCIYEFDLGIKVPFVLREENGLTLEIFNVAEQENSTYCLIIPIEKLTGYHAFYKDGKFILKIRKSPEINPEKPLKDLIIAIDAGHGGDEFGAIGCCGDKEKDINLAIAQNLYQELENRGAKVIMTREKDINVSLQDRVKIAQEKEAMLLISLHANALPDEQDPVKNRGTSVYYYHNQAKPLAQSILTSMTTSLGTQNDRVRQGSLALVRPTSSVSVLIEVAYMINPDDYALLLDKNFQKNCAKSIADGIKNYIKQF